MNPDMESFAVRYAEFSEGELYLLAHDYASLTEPAQAALRAEFANRNLEPPDAPPVPEPKPKPTFVKPVTIRRYRDLSEALVARSVLEAAEIPAFLAEENIARLEWQLTNFLGGIRLQVDAPDAEAATELLNQSVPESIPFAPETEYEQPQCPVCHSIDITFEGHDRRAALLAVSALSVPLPLGRETWLCNACNTRWQDTDDLT